MNGLIRRAIDSPVIKVDEVTRQVSHLISDATLDRMSDVIEPTGWQLDNFKRNPVVLADHSYQVGSIIGKSIGQKATERGLFARTQFARDGLGAQAFSLVKNGLAKAWSVGFKSIESHPVSQGATKGCKRCKVIASRKSEDSFIFGRHFLKTELVEYSLVAVPANPSAVMASIRKGVVSEDAALSLFCPTHVGRVRHQQQQRRLSAIERAIQEYNDVQDELLQPWRPDIDTRTMTADERRRRRT